MLGLKMRKSLGLFFAFAMMLTAMLGGFQATVSAETPSAATPVGSHMVEFDEESYYEHTTEVSGNFYAPTMSSFEEQYTVQITQGDTLAMGGEFVASVTVPVEEGGSHDWTVILPAGTSFSEGEITVELLDAEGLPLVDEDGDGVTEMATDTATILPTPPAPELNVQEVGAYSDTMAGTVTPGSEVFVSFNGDTPLRAAVDSTGKWIRSFDTPLAKGDVVTVTAVKDTVETTCSFEVSETIVTIDEPKPGDTVVTGSYSNLPATAACGVTFGVNMDFLPPTSVSTMEDSLNGDFTSGTFSIDLIFGGETYALQVGDEVELVLSDNAYDPAAAGTTVYAYASEVVESVDGTTPPPVDTTTPPVDGTTPPLDPTTPPTDSTYTGTNPKTFGTGVAIFVATTTAAGAGLVALKRRK